MIICVGEMHVLHTLYVQHTINVRVESFYNCTRQQVTVLYLFQSIQCSFFGYFPATEMFKKYYFCVIKSLKPAQKYLLCVLWH